MGWTTYTYPDGAVWKINYANVANLLGAYGYMVALSENIAIKTEAKYIGLGLDSEKSTLRANYLDYDHKAVNNRAKAIKKSMYRAFIAMLATTDLRSPEKFLAALRAKTMRLRTEHGNLVQKSNEMNQAYIAKANSNLWWAETARDTSALALTIIASVATGGTAVAAATLATGVTATGKYQDTGSVEEALKAGLGTVIMCGWGQLSNVAKTVGKGQTVALFGLGILVDGGLNVAIESGGNKKFGEAVRTAAYKALSNAAFAGMDLGLTKGIPGYLGEIADNTEDLIRFGAQFSGRMFEKATINSTQKPRRSFYRSPNIPAVTLGSGNHQAIIDYVRSKCIYLLRHAG